MKTRLKCLILQHEVAVGPGNLIAILKELQVNYTLIFASEIIQWSDPRDFDLVILLGGSMNVVDTDIFPWLIREKQWLKELVQTKSRILGLCLGGQLLAEALGAKVCKNSEAEIGWHLVFSGPASHPFPVLSSRQKLFHWHEWIFDLPQNCQSLGYSDVTPCQGFYSNPNSISKFIGTQFHPEADEEYIETLLEGEDWSITKFSQSPKEIRAQYDQFPKSQAICKELIVWLLQ